MANAISKVNQSVKNWWIFLIIGILMIIGAIWMFNTPVESFVGLTVFFSMLIFISGILTIIYAIGHKDEIENWGLYLGGGILDLIVGFVLLKYPGVTIVLFSLFVGFWLLFRGIFMISGSFKMKKEGVHNWGWILVFGILTTIFAFFAIINPLVGASYLVFTLAFAFLLLGIGNIFISLQLRKVKGRVGEVKEEVRSAVNKLE
ncbi:HdeD family acid-resistance protein [Namhaeicola litoreus]|uniref:HdeD family acid-resistance protein n=1 Tax=Namhaeicola litoreus TaxID=1052145 RepID=A0ABW3Y6F2_9FLAO